MRGIYAITNTVSDTVYYGQATKVVKRLAQHRWELRRGTHENPRLQKSFNKHGENAFVFTPVHMVGQDTDITLLEKQCIEGAYALGLRVYNIREPELKSPLSKETKAKQSVCKLGNKHALGCKRSEEWKKRNKERMFGKQYMLGKTHSDETKAKMSLARIRYLAEKRLKYEP